MNSAFEPRFTITNPITEALTRIERARGFLEAHYTTHIEGTRLTLEQSERLWAGEDVPEADPNDARELLNYRGPDKTLQGKELKALRFYCDKL